MPIVVLFNQIYQNKVSVESVSSVSEMVQRHDVPASLLCAAKVGKPLRLIHKCVYKQRRKVLKRIKKGKRITTAAAAAATAATAAATATAATAATAAAAASQPRLMR